MAELEEWLPNAIQAATAVGQLALGVTSRRQQQAKEWGELLVKLAELDADELRRLVEDNPALAELVGIAWEVAARTASEDKRSLLARLAAAALRGDSTPGRVDELQLLVRTVDELDPLHISLLVAIGAKPDGSPRALAEYTQQGLLLPQSDDHIRRDEIAVRWPSAPDLLDPAIAALDRAGLIMPVSDGYRGEPTSWVLRPYGRRFLDYLLIDDRGWPQKPAGAA
jgi:hypothetical protein